jgi:hypothetical protein
MLKRISIPFFWGVVGIVVFVLELPSLTLRQDIAGWASWLRWVDGTFGEWLPISVWMVGVVVIATAIGKSRSSDQTAHAKKVTDDHTSPPVVLLDQREPTDRFIIKHDLGHRPIVHVYDEHGNRVIPGEIYPNEFTCIIEFGRPNYTGRAILNRAGTIDIFLDEEVEPAAAESFGTTGEAIALTREGSEFRQRIGQDEVTLNREARAWGFRVGRFIEIHAAARLPEYDALSDLPDASDDYIEPPSRLIPAFVDARLRMISEVVARAPTHAAREELQRLYRIGADIRRRMRAAQPSGGGIIVRVPTAGSSIEDDYGFRVWEREVCAYLRKELPHQSEHFCAERAGDQPKIGGTITDTSKPTDEIDDDLAELGRIIDALP